MTQANTQPCPELSFYLEPESCDKIRLILPKLLISPRTAIVTDQRTPSQFLGSYRDLLFRNSQRALPIHSLFDARNLTIVSRSEFARLTASNRQFDRIVFENFWVTNSRELLSCATLAFETAISTQTQLSVVVSVNSEALVEEFELLCKTASRSEEIVRFWIGLGSESVRYFRLRADLLNFPQGFAGADRSTNANAMQL